MDNLTAEDAEKLAQKLRDHWKGKNVKVWIEREVLNPMQPSADVFVVRTDLVGGIPRKSRYDNMTPAQIREALRS
jgi:hypothetical protein